MSTRIDTPPRTSGPVDAKASGITGFWMSLLIFCVIAVCVVTRILIDLLVMQSPPFARSPTPRESARRRERCAPSPRRRLEPLQPVGLGGASWKGADRSRGFHRARDARQAAVEATAHARDELAGEAPSLAVLLGIAITHRRGCGRPRRGAGDGRAARADRLRRAGDRRRPPRIRGRGRRWRCGWRPAWPPKRSSWTSSAPARAACSPVIGSTGPRTICICCCRTRTHSRRACSSSTSTPTCRERP